MKEKIIQFASDIGFDDIRFAKTIPMQKPEGAFLSEPLVFDPRAVMPDAKSVILLFLGYMPASRREEGRMNVSEYNRASNRAYHIAKQVAAFLEENGAKARLEWRLYAKGIALMTGGFAGRNGLYYHDTLGSLVCIQTVITDLDFGEDYIKVENRCGNCRACIKACPAGAISIDGFDAQKCLRKYMNELMPEEIRGSVYQLFGCEICQSVCPHNAIREVLPVSFDTSELLCGGHLQELVGLAGKNTARSRRVISQALLYAGASRDISLRPYVEKFAGADSNTVREHALWAIKRMDGEL